MFMACLRKRYSSAQKFYCCLCNYNVCSFLPYAIHAVKLLIIGDMSSQNTPKSALIEKVKNTTYYLCCHANRPLCTTLTGACHECLMLVCIAAEILFDLKKF